MLFMTDGVTTLELRCKDFKTLLDAVEEERLSLVRACLPVPKELTDRKEVLRSWMRRSTS
jgi:hypothetical protein